jgi:pimeloyl-ACP methyl ester carboxylesterase
MRRPRALVITGVTALTVAGLLTVPAAGTAPSSGGIARFYQQKVNWQKCRQGPEDEIGKQLDAAGARCADLTVPLDYHDPGGATITVAISRLRAVSPAPRRLGPLLINDGGPGGPSLDMPLLMRDGMGAVGGRYDLIGMDPRFVGRSTPLDCDWPTSVGLNSAGRDRAGFDRSVRVAADLANRCARTASDVLPYATTRNTARDMDVVRGALGAPRLSYLGYSYGSYLGSVYLQLFGQRAGRIVLDGPVDPSGYGPDLIRTSGTANEAALADWASWTARRHATYGLGATTDEVLATVHRLIAAAEDRPLRVGHHRVDGSVVPMVLYIGVVDDREQPRANFAKAVRSLADAAKHGSAAPTAWLDEALTYLMTGIDSAGGSSLSAILCGDVPVRPGIEHYWRDIQRSRDEQPVFGPVVHNIGPCSFWPVRPRERPTRIHNDVPALIVAATGDPRTIYANAAALQRRLTGSQLVTLHGANVHGVYAEYGNACVDSAVNAYLDTATLPPADLVCRTTRG